MIILNDDIVRHPKSQNNTKQCKKEYEKRAKPKLGTAETLNISKTPVNMQEDLDNQKLYKHDENTIVINNIAPTQSTGVRCSYQSQSLPSHHRKTLSQLMKRMKEQIKTLLEQQLEVDYKIVTNEVIARDIAAKLSNIAGDKEADKFNLHVKELESVHSLVLGLAARLAEVEENIKLSKDYNSEKYSENILLVRKKEKLVEQLAEARWIKENIYKRSKKVGNEGSHSCLLLLLSLLPKFAPPVSELEY